MGTIALQPYATILFMKRLRPKDEGFTLIELLVVIIIISLLAAISLPSFLSQANKAKQSEAKTYIGTLNRVQQAFFLENNRFSISMQELANPVPEETTSYSYSFAQVNSSDSSEPSVASYGTAKGNALKSYVGMTSVSSVGESRDATTTAALCESAAPGATQAPDPQPPVVGSGEQPTCSEGTSKL